MPINLRFKTSAILLLAGSAHSAFAGPTPGEVELSALDGSNGFAINGAAAGDTSGISVSTAGDINGDGVADVVIGAYEASPASGDYAGKTFVVFGGAGVGAGGSVDLALLNGTNGFVINGEAEYDYSGFSVSNAGDINGDGVDDIVIGAIYATANKQFYAGKTYVVFGAMNIGSSGSLELADLNGANGFVINGGDEYDMSGFSVSAAGDINGDGCDDITIGAPLAFAGGDFYAGQAYVVFGDENIGSTGVINLAALTPTQGIAVAGPGAYNFAGFSVDGAGDVNGDGCDDLILGAPYATAGGEYGAGKTYVVFGDENIADAPVLLQLLNGTDGFAINGAAEDDGSGYSVAGAGDVNGDNFDDIIVGTRNAATGDAYIIFGSATVGAGGILDVTALNGTNGFVATNAMSGTKVNAAGDFNGDGVDDCLIGAYGADPGGRLGAGQTFLLYGDANIGSTGAFDLATIDGVNGLAFNGVAVGDASGYSAAYAGDINDDGATDIIIGAPDASPGAMPAAGQSYVIFGASSANPADLSGDGVVGAVDLATLIGLWGPCPAEPAPCPADFDDSGDVGASDLAFLIGFWTI